MKLDKRIHAYNSEIADISLKNLVNSKKFVKGAFYQISISHTPIYKNKNAQSQISEALYGETFKVFRKGKYFSFGQLQTDNYVGYINNDALSQNIQTPTHYLKAIRSYQYSKPDIKSPIKGVISLQSCLHVKDIEDAYAAILHHDNSIYYVFKDHIGSIMNKDSCPVENALKFIEAPYLWGGRTSIGLDCSSLIQLAYASYNKLLPRDSDLQEDYLHSQSCKLVGINEEKQKGDLVYWKGHVAMFIDCENIIHANAYHMKVTIENYKHVKDRIEMSGLLPSSIFRISDLSQNS